MAQRGVNKVILVGNLGRDPDSKVMPNGDTVTNLAVATSEVWKDKQTGEQKEKTEWHNITMFRKLAEIAGEYLKKGSKVYLEGKLQTRKWQDKDGNDRYTTEIVADEMQMLDSKNSDGAGQRQAPASANAPAQAAAKPAQAQAAVQAQAQPSAMDDFDDDIPFSNLTIPYKSMT